MGLQDPPDGECEKPGWTTTEFECKGDPDEIDKSVDEDGVVLDIGDFGDRDAKLLRPGNEEHGGCQTRRISHQSEEYDAEEIGIFSPFRPKDRVVGIESGDWEKRLSEGSLVALFGTQIDGSGDFVFFGVRDGRMDLGIHDVD